MVLIVATDLTPYRLRWLRAMLAQHNLEGQILEPTSPLPPLPPGEVLVVAIGHAAAQIARHWLCRRPELQIGFLQADLSSIVGLTANIDLSYHNNRERQQLYRLLAEWAQRQQQHLQPGELSPEVFLGQTCSELDLQPDRVMICQLTPELEVGVYPEQPQGRYPLEMTMLELHNLMTLREVLGGQLVFVKDAHGVKHTIDYGQG